MMKKMMAAAASLLLIAGQAAAATSDIAASTTPTAHARTVNHCDMRQKAHATVDQTRSRVANRCNYFGDTPEPWILGAVVVAGAIVFGVLEDNHQKTTSP